ncbi:MAG: hypothetical protein QOJ93_3439, partial [Actinomycetota bacterium]|nr:hypothetical protein [Actinomycetota bacterium]
MESSGPDRSRTGAGREVLAS